jgi:AcrR family transcriptional regulator
MAMPASTGIRERNKVQRRRAIRDAAEAIFREKGYDGATTREIAARAGVAIGTLFLYAPDKRDLLIMIVNDDLDVLTNASFASVPGDAPFIDQLEYIFRRRYEYWGQQPELSRYALQERSRADEHRPSEEMQRYDYRRTTIVGAISDLIEVQQRAGALRADEDALEMAWLFYAIYLAHLRIWLKHDPPDVDRGMALMRSAFRLIIRGVGTSSE